MCRLTGHGGGCTVCDCEQSHLVHTICKEMLKNVYENRSL